MKNVYLIIDLVDKIEVPHLVMFIEQITDILGISDNLIYVMDKRYGAYNTKKQINFLTKAQKKPENKLFLGEEHSTFYKECVDKLQAEQYFGEQQIKLKRIFRIQPIISSFFEHKLPLPKILDEIDINDFLLYMHNESRVQNLQSPYDCWSYLIRDIPIDQCKEYVQKIQLQQAENNYFIYPHSVEETRGLFALNIDFFINKIEIRVLPVLGRTENELMECLSAIVTQLLKSYPNSSAYMDSNTFRSQIKTPHEDCFNTKDRIFNDCIDQNGLRIRGYTKYCWLNANQYRAIGGDNKANELKDIEISKQQCVVHLKLKNQRQSDYTMLKSCFSPLLTHGQSQVLVSQIFERSVMLHTAIDDNEFDIYDMENSKKSLSLVEQMESEIKRQNSYNRYIMTKVYGELKKTSAFKQVSQMETPQTIRYIVRSNQKQALTGTLQDRNSQLKLEN